MSFRIPAAALGALWICGVCGPGYSWWDGGHMQVVLVGCAQMEPEEILALANTMREHPFYQRDFESVMPESVQAGSLLERAEWTLAHASNWPDIVRDSRHPGHSKYSRGPWHYVNQPIYLQDSDVAAFDGRVPANVSRTGSVEESERHQMNVVQALKWLVDVGDWQDASGEAQAVRICWVLHLIGDVHQPLHSAALFSMKKLPEGDRGGNDTVVRNGRPVSLHRLWDSAPGTAEDYGAVVATARAYLSNASLVQRGQSAGENLDVEIWLDESFTIARDEIYTDELLAELRKLSPNQQGVMGPVDMPGSYFEPVDRIATTRVVEAGYRLARVLETLLGETKTGAAAAAPVESR